IRIGVHVFSDAIEVRQLPLEPSGYGVAEPGAPVLIRQEAEGTGRHRPDAERKLDDTVQRGSILSRLPRQRWWRRVEKTQKVDLLPECLQLQRDLEDHETAEARTEQAIRPTRLNALDAFEVVGCHLAER